MNTPSYPESQAPVPDGRHDTASALRALDMQTAFERLHQIQARAQCISQCLGSALAAREQGEP